MDARTKEKYLRRQRDFAHMAAGHLSHKPADKSYVDAADDGLQATLALWQDFVTREYRAKIENLTFELETARVRETSAMEDLAVARAEVERLRSELALAKAKTPLPLLNYCERMHVRQSSPLPCGDRHECWEEPPCQHIPEGAIPVTLKGHPDICHPLANNADAWGIGRGVPVGDM